MTNFDYYKFRKWFKSEEGQGVMEKAVKYESINIDDTVYLYSFFQEKTTTKEFAKKIKYPESLVRFHVNKGIERAITCRILDETGFKAEKWKKKIRCRNNFPFLIDVAESYGIHIPSFVKEKKYQILGKWKKLGIGPFSNCR